jgi:hypothetical protein
MRTNAGIILFLVLTVSVAPGLEAGNPFQTAEEAVDAMVEAHGGMDPWSAAPTVSFTDSLVPAGMPTGEAIRITVEQGTRRVYMDVVGMEISLAWDGEKAWGINWGSPVPPRFLAQLNYYFLNLPWLVKDPGVILSELGTRTIWDDPTEYVAVRVTYDAGVGDTPDDYYVLYIDPDSHRIKGCEYIVTYADILPPGIKQTSPHLLIFDTFETVGGLVVPTHYTIYETDQTVYATCSIRDWSFNEPFDAARMEMPEDAIIDTSRPTREEP